MSDEKRFAVSNDDINEAIMLTWPTDTGTNLCLDPVRRQRLEHLVGKMAGAIRTEPDRIDAASEESAALRAAAVELLAAHHEVEHALIGSLSVVGDFDSDAVAAHARVIAAADERENAARKALAVAVEVSR